MDPAGLELGRDSLPATREAPTMNRIQTVPWRSFRENAGFTLLELMIVIAVVSIIAAMAIPMIQNARMEANEASAIGTIRSIISVNEQYSTRFSDYSDSLDSLNANGYIDGGFVDDGSQSGYTYSYSGSTDTYTINLDPSIPGKSGRRHFFADHRGVIRFSSNGPATSASPPLQR